MELVVFLVIVLISSANGAPAPNDTESARDLAADAAKAALAPLAVIVGADSAVLGFSTVKFGEGVKSVGSGVVSVGDDLSNLGKDVQVIGAQLFEHETGFPIPIVHTGTQLDALRVVCKLPKLFTIMVLGEMVTVCNSSLILEDSKGDPNESPFPDENSNDDSDSATTLKASVIRPPTPLPNTSTTRFKLPTTPSTLSTSSTPSTTSTTTSEGELFTFNENNFLDEE